jgi:hypothetical protein
MDYKPQLTDMVKTMIAQDVEAAREQIKAVIVAKSQSFMHGESTTVDTTDLPTDAE